MKLRKILSCKTLIYLSAFHLGEIETSCGETAIIPDQCIAEKCSKVNANEVPSDHLIIPNSL